MQIVGNGYELNLFLSRECPLCSHFMYLLTLVSVQITLKHNVLFGVILSIEVLLAGFIIPVQVDFYMPLQLSQAKSILV